MEAKDGTKAGSQDSRPQMWTKDSRLYSWSLTLLLSTGASPPCGALPHPPALLTPRSQTRHPGNNLLFLLREPASYFSDGHSQGSSGFGVQDGDGKRASSRQVQPGAHAGTLGPAQLEDSQAGLTQAESFPTGWFLFLYKTFFLTESSSCLQRGTGSWWRQENQEFEVILGYIVKGQPGSHEEKKTKTHYEVLLYKLNGRCCRSQDSHCRDKHRDQKQREEERVYLTFISGITVY